MIIKDGYLGYLKYEGDAVKEGIMDARDSANALLGFDEAFRYFIARENTSWSNKDLNLPVRIEKGCWEILIPAGAGVFLGFYMKAAAETAGKDGFLETGIAKDLTKVLKAALVSMKWIVKISKHLGAVGDTARLKTAKIQDLDNIIVFSSNNVPLVVPKKYYELYYSCPSALLSKCAGVINEGRELEIGSLEQNEVVDAVRISSEDRHIFYQGNDEDFDVLFPELEHGMCVELEGDITRVTESTNTLGFSYQGHVLFCKPINGGKIAPFKQRIISQKDDHLFPKVKIIGVVDRRDVHDSFKAMRPCIMFSDILRLESVTPSVLLKDLSASDIPIIEGKHE